MVFVPTHESTPDSHEASAAPRRPEHLKPPSTSDDGRRLAWRAVVHFGDKGATSTSWHVRECAAPHASSAHCPVGQSLIESQGDADGHCLLDGRCARCDT